MTEVEPWVERAVRQAIRRVRAIDTAVTDFPHITEKRTWQFTKDGVWTGGFWAGLLWLSSEFDNDADLRKRAIHFTDRLLPRAQDQKNHDLGFMFGPSAVKAWKVLGGTGYRDAARLAARSLASQFNPDGGYIPGWGFFGGAEWGGNVLIDTLMNLPLIVWAVNEGEDPHLLDVVRGHTDKSIRYLMREDGSVFHMYRFAPETGAPLGGDTYQGHAAHTTWSRGQAWAITALAMLGEMLGEKDYVVASERAATYFLGQISEGGVPLWDFQAPADAPYKDSSAAAIASYGLLRLFDVTGKRTYLYSATQLLSSLARDCANEGDEGGLLLHSTADLPHGHGIDESVMYGDYYYLKALLALRQRTGASAAVSRQRAATRNVEDGLLLDGVKVISLCHYLQGPAAAQYLADMGADVVKVEPITGAYERRWSGASTFVGDVSAFFLCANRNKRSLSLDLKSGEGKATLLRLVAQADVVMENFRPDTLDRLGLGYEILRKANPRIIFASASGYGADGPYANNPGQDLLVQARTGLVAATAGQQPDILPSAAGCAVVDQHGAALFAMGILGALYKLKATQQGTRVESSLFNAGIDLQQESISTYLNGHRNPDIFRRERHLATWFHEAPYGIFECADRSYVALSLNNLANVASAFEQLQHKDEAAGAVRRLREFNGDKFADRDGVTADVARIFAGQDRATAMEAMARFEVWFAPVTGYSELATDPQAVHNGVFTSYDVEGRPATFVTHPNRYDGAVPPIRHIAERSGADSDAVLRQYGFTNEEIASLAERGVVGGLSAQD